MKNLDGSNPLLAPLPPARAIVQQEQLARVDETIPLDKFITMGHEFPSLEAVQQILLTADQLAEGKIKGHSAGVCFHQIDGSILEIKIYKPYHLRKDKHGAIVQAYKNP